MKQLIAKLHIGAFSDPRLSTVEGGRLTKSTLHRSASTDAEDGVCAPVHTGREHVRTHFSSATDHRRRRGMQKAQQLTSVDGWRLTVSLGIAVVPLVDGRGLFCVRDFLWRVQNVIESSTNCFIRVYRYNLTTIHHQQTILEFRDEGREKKSFTRVGIKHGHQNCFQILVTSGENFGQINWRIVLKKYLHKNREIAGYRAVGVWVQGTLDTGHKLLHVLKPNTDTQILLCGHMCCAHLGKLNCERFLCSLNSESCSSSEKRDKAVRNSS